MAEMPVFYVRAPRSEIPPPRSVVEAAKIVLGESEETLARVAALMEAEEGYLSDARRELILLHALSDEKRASRLESLLNLGEDFIEDRGGIDGLIVFLEKWQSSTENQARSILTPDELSGLKRLLPIIIKPYPARKRQAKAERLAGATGLRAEMVDLICDMRPVFDDSRTRVEGLIPFTTLKVVAAGVDKFPVSFEAILSASDVQALLEKAKHAVSKLNALGRLAEDAKRQVPSVDLTETKE